MNASGEQASRGRSPLLCCTACTYAHARCLTYDELQSDTMRNAVLWMVTAYGSRFESGIGVLFNWSILTKAKEYI